MTPQERLALALQYQKQRDLGSALPSTPAENAARPVQEPEQSWLDKLNEAGMGFGYRKAQDLEDLAQAARHPLDTLHSLAVGVGKAMDNPSAAAQAAWQGIKQFAGEAVSSPYNLGSAVAGMTSFNPRKLAAMLESPAVREITAYHGTPHRFEPKETSFKPINPGDSLGPYVAGSEIHNTSSIASSLDPGYIVEPGIQEIPLTEFYNGGQFDLHEAVGGRADEIARTKKLAEAIKQSKRLDPLIVAFDEQGPYVLEGGHRLDAAYLLGAKSIPAMVVREKGVSGYANPLGEFDASKIGTGEGAQAYGHGIYLAQKPEVAQDYQFMLSKIDPETVTYQGKPVQHWYDMAQAEQNRAHRLNDRAAIDRANAKLAYWENVMTRRHPEDVKRVANDPDDGWKTFADYANSLDMNKFGGVGEAGSLYHADLPDEMIDRMLDWDKPLSEQSAAVQKLLLDSGYAESAFKKELGIDKILGLPNYTGKDLYQALKVQGDKNNSSSLLRQAGIPGIKYLDAGSRGATGTGTRNFVVFPGEEKKVKILERK